MAYVASTSGCPGSVELADTRSILVGPRIRSSPGREGREWGGTRDGCARRGSCDVSESRHIPVNQVREGFESGLFRGREGFEWLGR